jgi:hypothetical protein
VIVPTVVRADDVDVEVRSVAVDGIVVPLMLVAVATPRDGVVNEGDTKGA